MQEKFPINLIDDVKCFRFGQLTVSQRKGAFKRTTIINGRDKCLWRNVIANYLAKITTKITTHTHAYIKILDLLRKVRKLYFF